MYGHILLPSDGSPASEAALRSGIQLASALGARTSILTVTMPMLAYADINGLFLLDEKDYQEHMSKLARSRLEPARHIARAAGVAIETIHREDEQPWKVIVDYAEEAQCDLIVMASRGHTGLQRVLLGSQTQKVLAHSQRPVLVIR